MSSTRAITTFLLDLHRRSQELGYRAMQREALRLLQALLPHDAALFGIGTIQGGIPQGHDVFLEGRPIELMASWERIKTEDRLAFAAIMQPGVTVATAAAGELYDGCEGVRAHCARWDIAHLMCTAQIYAEAGLYWVMSLYRGGSGPAFTEDDRATKELLAPHLFAACRHARIGELRTLTRVGEGHGQHAAIVSPAGLVLEAEPGLVAVMQAEWPKWSGPNMPEPLWKSVQGTAGRFVGERIVARVDATETERLVHVRRKVIADSLTDREREVAEAFALGETHREIGERFAIAPATVRRHLANIYDKLGVSSKAELDRMLRGV